MKQTLTTEREETLLGRLEITTSLVDEEKVVEVRGFVVTCSASAPQKPERPGKRIAESVTQNCRREMVLK